MEKFRSESGEVPEVVPGGVPQEVAAEEAFLDAVASRVDSDDSDIAALREKVSQWYDATDGTSRKPPDDGT